ncbi:AraC family transcriptional regulator [Rhodococcus sp. NKCM2511]|uniref:GlxA family transcriptional regulator n=1 Tax=unclassified Rhodococcus (in: high G+C Gram-positive bacteria) TaxID=192944 RepID=UPI001A05AE62|nr:MULTISPECIES: DJ-1/PfpI family protein [unclassified Rhodococcus (in: high G+C Gram-positive bacteria)]GHP17689.1 AraC family transcriptional regulator [Rhodococcus sp. NKCM2511]
MTRSTTRVYDDPSRRGPSQRRRIGILLFDQVKMLDFVGPAEVFLEANQRVDGYDIVFLSIDGGDVVTSMGMTVSVNAAVADSGDFDTLIVPGSESAPAVFEDPALLDAVALLAPRARRVASICSGAFALAGSGLLDGRSATTHWKFTAALAERFPDTRVQPDSIFVRDGDIYTSAGVAAGIDLALALVESDHGAPIARTVAQLLLVYMQRSGGQSQYSVSLKGPPPRTQVSRAITDYIHADPTRPANLSALAAHANVSVRHLNRIVREELGTTPLDYVTAMRLDIAVAALESGYSVARAAADAGFGTPAAFRRAFVTKFGVTPSDYQRKFRTTDPAQ